jgi:hypothetical protein
LQSCTAHRNLESAKKRRRKEGKGTWIRRGRDAAPRFTVARVAHLAFLIATRCLLDMPLSHWKQTKAASCNRNKSRLLTSRFLRSAAPALSVRPLFAQVYLEASAMRVLDCGFRRVIAYPPGGGAVTLIQTQRANSQLEVSRHEMPVPTTSIPRALGFDLRKFPSTRGDS